MQERHPRLDSAPSHGAADDLHASLCPSPGPCRCGSCEVWVFDARPGHHLVQCGPMSMDNVSPPYEKEGHPHHSRLDPRAGSCRRSCSCLVCSL